MIDRIMSKFGERYCQCNPTAFENQGLYTSEIPHSYFFLKKRYLLYFEFQLNYVEHRCS